MNNIHGQRVNTDVLKPNGSGFVGSHGPDFLLTGDLASQILNLRYGPDGNAYVIDWYDTNACHHNNPTGHDRSNGRIYKVVYGESKPLQVDLTKLSDLELAEMALNKNDWYVRHARRALQERAAAGSIDKAARDRLTQIVLENSDPTRQLRALWSLHVTGGLSDEVLGIIKPNEHVVAWLLRLLTEDEGRIQAASQVKVSTQALAASETSPVVRLAIAAALQKVTPDQRWMFLNKLVKHAEDAKDHNLPLMYWYAMEPLAEADPPQALALGLSCGKTIPMLRQFMLQRLASESSPHALAMLLQPIIDQDDADQQRAIFAAIRNALKGQRQVSPPDNWPAAFAKVFKSKDDDLRREAAALGATFGDSAAMATLRATVDSPELEAPARREALDALLRAKDPGLLPTLLRLVGDRALREPAIAGLSLYEDDKVPPTVLAAYPTLSPQEKRAALATLASRPAYALELLRAVSGKKIPATDIAADLVRQLQNLKHDELNRLLAEVWGQVRSTPEEKLKLIAELRRLAASPPAAPDLALGRAVYAKTCQQCHTLFGAGSKIGPDITGANRTDLEYLLSNIVDPSAVITKDYQQTVVLTVDGLTVSGLVKSEDDKSLTIQTTTDVVVIPKDEIEDRQLSDVSMMPDDQLKQFSPHHIASLLAYLASKEQTPLLATKENQELLFNGKDLTGWHGNEELWSVENGEIVGRAPNGLPRNEFLFSDMAAEDFTLTLEVKLIDDKGNSGIQFRSEPYENGEARGYQADMGPGWWGKLYEESARGLLWDKSGEPFVKKGDWNEYKIVAHGGHIQTWLNGHLCVDLDDPQGKRRGQFAVQLHSGDPTEVRFRNLKLEVHDK
jgi:putative heme-binding domain-containing protein